MRGAGLGIGVLTGVLVLGTFGKSVQDAGAQEASVPGQGTVVGSSRLQAGAEPPRVRSAREFLARRGLTPNAGPPDGAARQKRILRFA